MSDETPPLVPHFSTAPARHRTVCQACGVEDGTVQVTTIGWRERRKHPNGCAVSVAVCLSCGREAARGMGRHETSASVAQWQTETFGHATTTAERIERSGQRMTSAMFDAEVAARHDPTIVRPNLSRAIRAAEELAELIAVLARNDSDPKALGEVADVRIVLHGILAAHGVDGQDVDDAKMAINRRRRWATTGDGHGQHVEDEP